MVVTHFIFRTVPSFPPEKQRNKINWYLASRLNHTFILCFADNTFDEEMQQVLKLNFNVDGCLQRRQL